MKNILLVITCFFVTGAMAQKKPLRKQRLIFSHGVGYSFALNSLPVDPVIDQLVDMNGKGVLLNFFTVNWFMKNNIGIELRMQGLPGDNTQNRKKTLELLVEDHFGDQYYYQSQYGFNPNQSDGFPGFAGLLGLTCKFERGRFSYIPKFYVGYMDVSGSSSYTNILKEKNTNTILSVRYQGDPDLESAPVFGPAASVMYRFNSLVGIRVNASYLWHKAGVHYERRITDLATNNTAVAYYSNEKTLHRIHIDLSIAVGFGRRGELVEK
jgi:hypothetical protein